MDLSQNSSVLVTGGRGFIGRGVGKLLERSGYNVISLDTSSLPSAGADPNASGRDIVCDITDAGQLEHTFAAGQIGAIIHLAAILPTAAGRAPLRATQVNIDGSLNLLEAARQCGVRRMIFGSSLSVYGTCAADQVVSETIPSAPEDLYAAAKLYVERTGDTYRDCHRVEFVSLRIGRVIGPGAQSTSSPWRSQIFEFLGARDAAEIALPYVGSERVLLVHVDDVAKMLVTLLDASSPMYSVYNAPSESVVVSDLKCDVEKLNSNVSVKLGGECATGNPRLLDATRFRQEFGFQTVPIFEQLRRAAERTRAQK
jgi:nucleoside-diphosphate-sugar epimerase